jgi:hypothetical protein
MNGWRKDIPKLLGNISPDALMRMKLDEQMLLVEGVVQVDADDGWAMPSKDWSQDVDRQPDDDSITSLR